MPEREPASQVTLTWPRGRVVVVTGASQGIGREIAIRFAARGARIVLAARSREALAEVSDRVIEAGGEALTVVTDVSEETGVAALRDAALEWGDGVDTLVNNAGIAGPTAVLWEQSLDDWDAVMRVNVTGVFLCCRAFLPSMLERRTGSVVTIASITGKTPLPGRTPYAASKMALIGITRTLAAEAGPAGVRVNLVSPGAVSGERINRVLDSQALARGADRGTVLSEVVAGAALRRLVNPVDVADTVLFLASPAAASITGEDLNVSAGFGNR